MAAPFPYLHFFGSHMLDQIGAIVVAKSSTIIAASVGAVISILLNLRDHSLLTAILSLAAGVAVAFAATDPLIDYFGLSPKAGSAVAGALGIVGRNVIIALRESTRDPIATFNRLRGKNRSEK